MAGPRGGEHGACSPGNTAGGLKGNQPLEIRQHYKRWTFGHEDIHGFPPSRTCRLYGSTSETAPFVLVDEKEYPGHAWYLIGLLIIAAPLLVLGAIRLSQTTRAAN